MWRKLVNWLRGYLEVQIKGNAPERFINLCYNKRILIWNLKRVEEDYRFRIQARDYRKLKPIAKKTGMIPRIKEKIGLPFYMHRYRKHKFFFAGLLLCGILVYIMSLYIWDIQILGGSKYTPEAMTKFLKENEIYTGIKKKKVDCQEIEDEIRLAYNDIGWVSAEIKGTRLIIKITETNMPAPARIARDPSHIVATKDSIIKSIITRTGTPVAKPGDVVKKGDILVSGIVAVKGDFDDIIKNELVVADATISCKSYYDYSDNISMNYIAREFSGEKKIGYYFSILGKKIFLHNPSHSYDRYDIIVNENTLHVTETFYLPFRYGTITVREYKEKKMTYTGEEAREIANKKLQRYLKRLTDNGVTILDHNIEITIENNFCITQGRIIVEEPAWEYQKVQDNEWRIEQTDEYN
ncbi:MAG: sporulation protein YqfD [Lachnospiraceae bacterium]|jgi:similar to stage IV sporulation protein|nr:sporulation protein YqfD [Lachnospiraceae bacterium]